MRERKVTLIVLDAVGCGNAPDAAQYGDAGANTLRHTAEKANPALPNLCGLGLGNIPDSGFIQTENPAGAWGRLTERSAGKDTTTGHWEIAGLPVETPFPTYPDGFPQDVLDAFEAAIGRQTLATGPASGTEIIDRLGPEHMETGRPIVYTSADSVFQVAAHEGIIPPEALWRMCEIARGILTGPHAVGRVIARPFVGQPGAFQRTGNRRDFSLVPFGPTVLDVLHQAGIPTMGVGKIEDIFAHRGLSYSNHASGNTACIAETLSLMEKPGSAFIFVNLVDTDMLYGHRRDPIGFGRALEEIDRALPEMIGRMGQHDLLILTADHGCDPTYRGTDHTRERVPLLCYGPSVRPGSVGDRASFADIAATVQEAFGVPVGTAGESFYQQIIGR